MTLEQYGAIFGALLTAEIHFKVESEMDFNSELTRKFAARNLAKVQAGMKALDESRTTQHQKEAASPVAISTHTIRTSCVCPPVPVRNFDWAAWVDGREEWKTGTGATEQEAVADLLEQIEEAA